MHTHCSLMLVSCFVLSGTAAAEELAITYDYLPAPYAGQANGQLGEIPMSTKLRLGDWTLRTRTSLYLFPYDPLARADPNQVSMAFGSTTRAISGDTRFSIERPLGLGGNTWLTAKGQLRLPTAGPGLYQGQGQLEGAMAMELASYPDDWMFWGTARRRFQGNGSDAYPRRDAWDVNIGAARIVSKRGMTGLTVSHWQSTYKNGRSGNNLTLFHSENFKRNKIKKGELRAYISQQYSRSYSETNAAIMVNIDM